MFEGPIRLIKKSKKISLFTHQEGGGDGDALGSLLALSFALFKLERKIDPVLAEEVSSNFSFLPGLEMLDKENKLNPDLIILLDFADLKRGSYPYQIEKLIQKVPSILIDHHPKGDLYPLSTFKLHGEKFSSTAEILYFLILNLGVPFNREIATLLLTGIFTDTNSFQNPNTYPQTFKVASSLLSSGAKIEKIAQNVFYQKPVGVLKLWGRALSRLKRNEKYDLLMTFLRSSDFSECGVGKEGAEGLANFLNLTSFSPSGILFLIEEDGKIKGSLRTTKEEIDISKLAKILGGGGHRKAAGFEIEGKLKFENGEWRIV